MLKCHPIQDDHVMQCGKMTFLSYEYCVHMCQADTQFMKTISVLPTTDVHASNVFSSLN